MHDEAYAFVARQLLPYQRVVEIGGRDINGTVRELFTAPTYLSLDLYPGPGVDVVIDCRTWQPPHLFDAAVCCEVLEHTPDPQGIVHAAARLLDAGGDLIVTCATDPREPHSHIDGCQLRDGEHYANIPPAELQEWARDAGLTVQVCEVHPRGDLYLIARKP